MLAANARLAKNIKEEVRMSGPRNKQRKDGVLLHQKRLSFFNNKTACSDILTNKMSCRSLRSSQIAFNPYPKHLHLTPRDSAGNDLVKKVSISKEELEKMHKTFFTSELPEQDDEFVRKFTKHMYDQVHKKLDTIYDMGNDPFKLTAEEMFKKKNEAKYSSKFVGPCFDMGSRPNWNYNEYHGGTVGMMPF